MSEPFHSADSRQPVAPLRHARTLRLPGPVPLKRGGALAPIDITYETWGRLSPAKDNAVLVCHALSGDSHAARHTPDDEPGWWETVVGPGKPIDTDRFFVICPNVLGGCRGTTGPNSPNPATGKPYGRDFPAITVDDMVDVQRMLLDELGIDQLLAVVGGSLGGHQALTWAVRYRQRVRAVLPIATSPRLTSQALAFDIVARNAILRDPHYHDGQYYDKPQGPDVGLAIARMLGHITYLSREAMTEKFDPNRFQPHAIATEFEKEFSVGSYLAYQGHKFVERFDANSYLTLSLAMDHFDLGATKDQLVQTFSVASARWLIVSFSSDWLFPPFQSRDMAHALIAGGHPVSYCQITTSAGHDAFLLEDDLDRYGQLIRGFLNNLHTPASAPAEIDEAEHLHLDPRSIYHAQRLDYDTILDLIEPGASVLDLGCGSGGLLARLKQHDHHRLMGVEWQEQAVATGVQRGLDVVQHDLNHGLGPFADRQFDYVVLSQALQAVSQVQRVLEEMLRVGRRCIVSFPNVAHEPLRQRLAEHGYAPVPGTDQEHDRWHNTPNIRFCSIADFEDFCKQHELTVHEAVYLDTAAGRRVTQEPNRQADMAVYVLGR